MGLYLRETIENLSPAVNNSQRYWRKQARDMFAQYPTINKVECVTSSNKLDSKYVRRGDTHSPQGVIVIIASSSGRWGKSRRTFLPV